MKCTSFLILFILCSAAFSCKKEKTIADAIVYKATGDLSATLDAFRNRLGNLNTTTGAGSGRREINWDGVPDSLLNKTLPFDFFNPVDGGAAAVTRQRGLVYSNGNFQVSATNFSQVNSEAASQFSAFSGTRAFANVSTAQWPVEFRVAGETTTASVKAFGMVFDDVDVEGSTTLEFFDDAGSVGTFTAPAHDTNTPFSFLGVYFNNKNIIKVTVSHQGTLSSGGKDISQGGTNDLIVVDDLIYSEPLKRQD